MFQPLQFSCVIWPRTAPGNQWGEDAVQRGPSYANKRSRDRTLHSLLLEVIPEKASFEEFHRTSLALTLWILDTEGNAMSYNVLQTCDYVDKNCWTLFSCSANYISVFRNWKFNPQLSKFVLFCPGEFRVSGTERNSAWSESFDCMRVWHFR